MSTAPRSTPAKFQIRSLLWSVYAPSFLLTFGQGILIPILPIYARDVFGSSDVLIALMITARPLGTMLFDVPAGVLVGILGLRRTMMAGILLFAVGAIIGGLSPNFSVLMMGRLFAGSSFALWSISRQVYIAQTVPVASRGKALSMFGGLSRVATIAAVFAGGLLYDHVDHRAPFFAQAIVAVLTAGMVMATFKGTMESAVNTGKHNIFPVLGHTLVDHRRVFATAGLAAIMLQFLRAAREYIIPLWADEMGLSGSQSGYIFGVSSIIDSVMFPVVGFVMDRWGRKHVGIPAYLILASGFAVIPFADSFFLLMMVGVLVGLGNGLSSGLVLTMGVDFAPRKNPGEFMGVWRLISDVGGASGPAAIGGVAGLVTLGTASVLTAGTGLLGAAILLFFVKETLVKDNDPPDLPAAKT
jgi:MFS family permease